MEDTFVRMVRDEERRADDKEKKDRGYIYPKKFGNPRRMNFSCPKCGEDMDICYRISPGYGNKIEEQNRLLVCTHCLIWTGIVNTILEGDEDD